MAVDASTLPAWAQAERLADGATSARALLEAGLDRIATLDGDIGALWHVDVVGARMAADQSDQRRQAGRALSIFDGLGMVIKDNIDVVSMPTTAGIAAYRGRIARQDAPVVARLRAAGIVIIGKSALHEGALGATTDTPGFGRCQNPLGPGLTPGGSSGGSAAAVAARFVPLAIGTDTMGSVRIPAAYCGVSGFKPTAGLVSRSGTTPLSATLDSIGALALTPRDAALCLELIAGFDAADQQSRNHPSGWRAMAGTLQDLSGQMIGLPRGLGDIEIEPGILADYAHTCRLLEARGARLVDIAIAGWEPAKLRRAALLLAEAEAAVAHPEVIDDPSAATDAYRAALAFGRSASAGRLVAAQAQIAWGRTGMERALQEVDALFLPTAPQRAFAHGAPVPANQADLTVLANVAGLPAIALPWPASDGGLPASLQLIGRAFDEARITGIADVLLRN